MIPSYRKDSLEQHYKIINQLGKGAMGITYAAEDVKTGQKIALKVISLQNISDAKHLELLEREVTVLKQLNHPNIPQYFDYFQLKEDNKLYLVQELVLGKNLNQQVEAGLRLTEGEVKNIAQQVLSILDYLHNFQPSIIHRDIKPHNLILCDDGQIFLVDFGAVHNAYYNTMIGGTVGIGTIGYMSPEQQIGKPVPASDLYSLGRTLLYLLTNRPPDHLLAHKETVNLDHIRDYIQLSDEFIQWLEKILDPDVDERFSSAKEALKSLKNTNSINKEKINKVGWFALIGLGVASVTLGTFSYNYRWLILNSLGFSAPAKVCWDKDITKEYFKSVGNLAKGNYNKDICGYFLDSLIGRYKQGDKGDKEIIKFLIDHGVNMNSTFKAEQPTLLERLVRSGDMEIIELLISGNDGVNIQDAYGSIALHYAAKEGDTKVIELLINHGADVNVQDNDGRTPLHYAAIYTKKTDRNKTLTWYPGNANKETVEVLINHGADVNARNKYDRTPLHNAAMYANKETVEVLINHGADVNTKTKYGITPLHDAAQGENNETIEALINNGADVNVQDNDGKTPIFRLFNGATMVNKEILELFINNGADVNVQDNDGKTPLYYAVMYAKKETVELLINYGADVNARDKHGITPLHNAAMYANKETVEVLINHGADVNVQDNDGNTPLNHAEWRKHREIIVLLKKHGAR